MTLLGLVLLAGAGLAIAGNYVAARENETLSYVLPVAWLLLGAGGAISRRLEVPGSDLLDSVADRFFFVAFSSAMAVAAAVGGMTT